MWESGEDEKGVSFHNYKQRVGEICEIVFQLARVATWELEKQFLNKGGVTSEKKTKHAGQMIKGGFDQGGKKKCDGGSIAYGCQTAGRGY